MILLAVPFAFAVPVVECPRPFTSAELIQAADRAEERFAEQDPAGFGGARMDVRERLGCVKDPLSSGDVVRVQRVMALGAFFEQDEARMRAAVGGMVQVDITARFPEAVLPSGHKLDKLVDELAGLPHQTGAPLRAFSDGWIEVNGAYAPTVDSDVAATLQHLDNQGQVVETRYWTPGEPLGDWEAAGAAPVAGAAPIKARVRKTVILPDKLNAKTTTGGQIARENAAARHTALIVSGGVGMIATGVLYAIAADAKEQALDPEVPEARAQAWRDQANGLTWGWIAGSVLSGGLVATLAITW
ncbi:MAG: hypothetical protein EXR71_16615 [Myxococcales bacterium]|nr:hypothetical protein [Myxococcales bacterium]